MAWDMPSAPPPARPTGGRSVTYGDWDARSLGASAPASAAKGAGGVMLPALAVLLAATIFMIDTLTPLDTAIAVLYVVVVLLMADRLGPQGIIATGATCVSLAILSFLIMHASDLDAEAVIRCGVGIAAIGVTTVLSVKNKVSTTSLASQAALLDLTHDAILVRDANEIVIYWSRGAEELYGWSKAEALGQNILALLNTQFPTDRQAIVAQVLATGRWDGELRHSRKDGTHVVVASRWALLRDSRGRPVATMATNTDITERKRSEEQLALARAELLRVVDAIPAMVWSADAETGALLFVNARWADVGWQAADLGPDWWSLAHPDDRAQLEELWTRARRSGDSLETTVRMRHADGLYRWMLVQCTALRDATGKIIRWYGLNTDIQDRRAAEDALHQAQSDLAHMTRLTTLGELTASIAHEVNQPLAAVVTNGEACLRWLRRPEPDVGEALASAERIIASGRRASDVIARLRAMSRRGELQRTPARLNEIVEDTLPLVERELLQIRVDLTLHLSPDTPPVLVDRVQIQQVLINLILNAAQAMASMPEGARRLTIVCERDIAAAGMDMAAVAVRDSGSGIDPSNLPHLFTAFFSTKPDGMGMGLSISRSIIEAHAGRIVAIANADVGMTFRVSLPAIKESTP